jgi:pyruvate dehydrogenase E2 component (dihydrolipoamide acetyltransferase)
MHEAAITMPKLSMTMEEGELVEWEVGEGDPVAAGDVVCRVMTDKTEMDVEAPAAGTLVRVVVGAGESVEVGTTLAFLSTEDRDMLEGMFDDPAPTPVAVPPAAGDSPAEGAQPVMQAKVAAPAAGREVSAAPVSAAPVSAAPVSAAPLSAVRVRSVPAARALAGSLGVDLGTVP